MTARKGDGIDPLVELLIRFGCDLYYRSRYFTKTPDKIYATLLIVFEDLKVKIKPDKKGYFRGRLHRPRNRRPKRPYALKQIGAPPGDISTAGRLNSAGISRLYLASMTNVVTTEIGAVTGDYITTARFVPKKSIKAVDFRRLTKIENAKLRPFADYIGRLPTAHIDSYHSFEMVLTQWLVEFFQFMGCEAVLYKSVATGRESRYSEFLPPIDYYNICAFRPEDWKMVRGSAEILQVRYIDAGAFDDKTWIELQVLEDIAKNPEAFMKSTSAKKNDKGRI